MNNKSVFGLNENLAAALAYLGTFVTGIIILILEKENKFVRFAALQSTVFFVAMFVVTWIVNWLTWIPILGWIFGVVSALLGLASFIMWIILMIKAYQGQAMKLPILGDICWEQVHK
ncbi:MAG: DUF4870 domain-containing protein [Defluviitaleaceae bacterium]|nr:DUF4870 domain-containing protein [Defluviitaleaceae bacterium]